MLPLLLALSPAARAATGPGPTGETGDTGAVVVPGGEDTGTPTGGTATGTGDTGIPSCPDCYGAAQLAGDEGGSPCQSGSQGTQAGLLLLVPALLIGRRR